MKPYIIKKSNIKILFCGIFICFYLHTNAQKRQLFHIENFIAKPNIDASQQNGWQITFDCRFGKVLPISQARCKFWLEIQDSEQNKVYKNISNYVSAMATEVNQEKDGYVWARKMKIFIPFSQIKKNDLDKNFILILNAENQEVLYKKLISKTISLPKTQSKNLPYSSQVFETTPLLVQNELYGSEPCLKLSFEVQFTYPYYDFENLKNLANAQEFYFYVILKDSTQKITFQPYSGSFIPNIKGIKPNFNTVGGNKIISKIELYVPFKEIKVESGENILSAQIYASNYDQTYKFPILRSQTILIKKP
jgi:hypothetical protein